MTVEVEGLPIVAADAIRAAVTLAIVGERAGVLGHARSVCASITAIEARGALGHSDASYLRRVLRNFANDIAIGFHVDGEPSPELRAQLREMMEAARG